MNIEGINFCRIDSNYHKHSKSQHITINYNIIFAAYLSPWTIFAEIIEIKQVL